MLLLPRLRLALARRPWLYWLFVAGCASIVWSTVSSAESRLDQERQRWGETRRVWIAAVDIAPGDLVRSEARVYPVAMLPASAINDQPIGVIATTSISAGEVLVAADIDYGGDDLLPPDWVVFALAPDNTPSLRQGDTVAIFGSGQRWCDGVLFAVADDRNGNGNVEVGVPAVCADAVSVQVAAGTIVLAVTT